MLYLILSVVLNVELDYVQKPICMRILIISRTPALYIVFISLSSRRDDESIRISYNTSFHSAEL